MMIKYMHRSHRYLRSSSVLLIGLLLSIGSAAAQPQISPSPEYSHFSVMLAIGYSRTALQRGDTFSGIDRASSPQFRAQFDYRSFRYMGLSGGMNLLGSTAYRGVSQIDGRVSQSGEISSMSAELAAAGYLPLTVKSTLYVRGGVAYINMRQSSTSEGGAASVHANVFSPLAGIGVELDLRRFIAFRVGLDWYFKAGDAARLGGEGAIQAAYGGFVFRFD
ncbi:hypothetical protein KQI65_09675 [bacterium]|nr:hypothetical protein [bacterium]